MVTQIGNRVIEFMTYKKWNKAEFAKRMSISPQNVNNYLIGKLGIEKFFIPLYNEGCDIHWLISGIGGMIRPNIFIDLQSPLITVKEEEIIKLKTIICELKASKQTLEKELSVQRKQFIDAITNTKQSRSHNNTKHQTADNHIPVEQTLDTIPDIPVATNRKQRDDIKASRLIPNKIEKTIKDRVLTYYLDHRNPLSLKNCVKKAITELWNIIEPSLKKKKSLEDMIEYWYHKRVVRKDKYALGYLYTDNWKELHADTYNTFVKENYISAINQNTFQELLHNQEM